MPLRGYSFASELPSDDALTRENSPLCEPPRRKLGMVRSLTDHKLCQLTTAHSTLGRQLAVLANWFAKSRLGSLNIQEIADEINGLETGKKEADFAIAKVAKRASGELNPTAKKELHKKLKMKKHKFSRYVYIGGELSELEPIIQHLPEGYSLLDAIARRIRHHINYAVIANDLHDIAEGSHQGIAGRGGEVRPSRSILFNVGITARRPDKAAQQSKVFPKPPPTAKLAFARGKLPSNVLRKVIDRSFEASRCSGRCACQLAPGPGGGPSLLQGTALILGTRAAITQ